MDDPNDLALQVVDGSGNAHVVLVAFAQAVRYLRDGTYGGTDAEVDAADAALAQASVALDTAAALVRKAGLTGPYDPERF